MPYTPSPAFEKAAGYLSKSTSLSKVSNHTKLELYGLYKCITVSPMPAGSRPSIFDMTGRAKWDVWKSTGATYGHRISDTEQRYLDIARELGWVQGAIPDTPIENDDSIEDILNSDSVSFSGGGGGMGNAVSSLALPSHRSSGPVKVETLHDLAIAGNAQRVSAFLEANPSVDLNQLDEYGYTPLHLACDRGSLAVVELLLSKGTDASIKDPDDFTAQELANVAGHDDICALFKR